MNQHDHAEGGAAHPVHSLQDASRIVRAMLRGQAFRLQSVGVSVPDDLPKMTKLTIDGKALYVHRANYVIMDTDAL